MARVQGTVFQRFLAKIAVSETLSWGGTPCWIWSGKPNRKGYGNLLMSPGMMPRSKSAHRLSHEIFKGEIPSGLQTDHLCRNRICVNPDHLEAVTSRVNHTRGLGPIILANRQRSKTHCPQGHEYSPKNTWLTRRGHRACKACKLRCKTAWRKRRKVELSQQVS